MGVRNLVKQWRKRRLAKLEAKGLVKRGPLREFIYLDEVSIQSLLVSQKSTILENVSEGVTRAVEAEINSSLSADALVGKGDVAARYQVSRGSNVQTSRRAIVQTLFKEFRELPLLYSITNSASTSSPPLRPADLERGNLVELEVVLQVDPTYKLVAMMTEYGAMAETWPAMFGQRGLLDKLESSRPIMRVFERFLAELVPLKSVAVDYFVVRHDGEELVVHRSDLPNYPSATSQPLYVTGVTERFSYWKDLRRVLYSEGRYTVLCRIARSGLQRSWTPVKLADLFSDVAPDLVGSINAIRKPSEVSGAPAAESLPRVRFEMALLVYAELLAEAAGDKCSMETTLAILGCIDSNPFGASAEEQRAAFDQTRRLVEEDLGSLPTTPSEDVAFRQAARTRAGISAFGVPAPELESESDLEPAPAVAASGATSPAEWILDTEVIAIYW